MANEPDKVLGQHLSEIYGCRLLGFAAGSGEGDHFNFYFKVDSVFQKFKHQLQTVNDIIVSLT